MGCVGMSSEFPRETPVLQGAAAADSPSVRAAIARAKLEWEGTVDALPDLICLLDEDGRILRINRVVERWHLGSLSGALGKDLHGVLHANCPGSGCQLAALLSDGWSALHAGTPTNFELRDA